MAKDLSTYTDPPYPQGIVKNNPGNLRIGIPWQGLKIGIPGGFCSFVNLTYGLRAMAIDLTNKITKDGLNTVSLIINKYAPPSENNTQAYIDSVCAATGWGPDDVLTADGDTIASLMKAQIGVEQGPQYASLITDQDIADGIAATDQSILTNSFTGFFVDNPQIMAVSGLGIAAVILVALAIVFRKINLSLFKKMVK